MNLEEKVAGINPHKVSKVSHRRRRGIGVSKKTAIGIFAVLIAGTLIASGAILSYYGSIETTANVSQSVVLDGKDWNDPITQSLPNAIGGGTYCYNHYIKNNAPIEATVQFVTTYNPWLTGTEITTTYSTAELQASAPGIAVWSTEQAHTGEYSAKLNIPAIGGTGTETIARVVLERNWLIDDINSLSFQYYVENAASYCSPYLILNVTMGSQTGELWSNNAIASPLNEWRKADAFSGEGFTVPAAVWENPFTDVPCTFAELKVALSGATVNSIVVLLDVNPGEGGGIAYVDDIEVNGVTYGLEELSENTPFTLQPGQKLPFRICYDFAIGINPDSNYPYTPDTDDPYIITTKLVPT